MKAWAHRMIGFLRRDVWRIPLEGLPRGKSFLLKVLRIVLLAVRGFHADQCALRASALTFYSILSIVPVVAVGFGIAKGFGFQAMLRSRIEAAFVGHEEVSRYVVNVAEDLLRSARGGVIAGIGVAILLWAVIRVLGNIEKSFNVIWGIRRHRPLSRRFTDYLSLLLICPLLLVLSSGATVVVTSKIEDVVRNVAVVGFFGPVILPVIRLLPYCIVWGLFAFLYIFIPNTKVKLRSGILAGVLAGTVFQLVQWAYISFQIGVTGYNAVYGSLTALPLFLVWLQVSWLVVLFGAEVSFAHQNVETYEFEPDCLLASHSFRTLVALKAAHLCVRNFVDGESPRTAAGIARELGAPVRLVHDVLDELVDSGVLTRTQEEELREPAYQPGKDTAILSVGYVIQALNERGIDDIPMAKSPELDQLSRCIRGLAEAGQKSPANVLLRDIR